MDDLERSIVALLSDRAERVAVPRCPVAEITANGRGRRYRRAALSLGMAGAAVVVFLVVASLVVSGLGRQGQQPPAHPSQPVALSRLGTSGPVRIPFWLNGSLHVGSRSLAMPRPTLVGANGVTLVVRGREVSLIQGQRLVPLPLQAPVTISPSGEYAAGEQHKGPDITLVLWNLQTRQQVGRLVTNISHHAACCGGGDITEPDAVDDGGRVYLQERWGDLVWLPGTSHLTQIRHSSDAFGIVGGAPMGFDGEPGGAGPAINLTTQYTVSSVNQLSVVHRFTAASVDWSGDGSRAALVQLPFRGDQPSEAGVLDLSTGQRVSFALPLGTQPDPSDFAWESSSTVLIAVEGTHGRAGALLRCESVSGACTRVSGLGPHWHDVELPGPGAS